MASESGVQESAYMLGNRNPIEYSMFLFFALRSNQNRVMESIFLTFSVGTMEIGYSRAIREQTPCLVNIGSLNQNELR